MATGCPWPSAGASTNGPRGTASARAMIGQRLYQVDVRVPIFQIREVPEWAAIDRRPPASGPEYEVTYEVKAWTKAAAEMSVRHMLEWRGVFVLALRSRRLV